jgi:hypothetical protein
MQFYDLTQQPTIVQRLIEQCIAAACTGVTQTIDYKRRSKMYHKHVKDLTQADLAAEYVGCGVVHDYYGNIIAIYKNGREAAHYNPGTDDRRVSTVNEDGTFEAYCFPSNARVDYDLARD